MVALKDIEVRDELYVDYGSGYFEGGCPCHSCNAQLYEAIEEKEYEHEKQQHRKEGDDQVTIAVKRKEQNKRRRVK